MKKQRLDALLIEKAMVEDKKTAFIAVTEGNIFVNGQKAISPAQPVDADAKIEIRGGLGYVGRGALKLEGALDRFKIDVSGAVCADIGSATGGFTEVLLKRGAKKVYAIDTAKGKLALNLREDPRVVVKEGVDVRSILVEEDKKAVPEERAGSVLSEKVAYGTIDVSLVSLRFLLPHVRRFLLPRGAVIALFKPQYETRDPRVLDRGVIKDTAVRIGLLEDFIRWAEENGWRVKEKMESPIRGSKGNVEFLLHLEQKEEKMKNES